MLVAVVRRMRAPASASTAFTRFAVPNRRQFSAAASASPPSEALTFSVDSHGAATITLNNAAKRNPLSSSVLRQMREYLVKSLDDSAVRVVILASTGPVFSSGHDVREFGDGATPQEQAATLRLCSEVNVGLRTMRKPTIASVQGLATAAGCQLVSSCDLVIASQQSRFATPGAVRGRFCHTPGIALADKIHPRKALEMLLLGEEISAEEAQRLGLVNRVVAHEKLAEETQRLAHRLCRFMLINESNMLLGKECFLKTQDIAAGAGAGAGAHTGSEGQWGTNTDKLTGQAEVASSLLARYGVAEQYMLDMFLSKESRAETRAFLAKKSGAPGPGGKH